MRDDMQTRDNNVLELDFDTRMMSLRVASINEEDRSIEAVLSSDSAVEMYDWRRGEVIDELLLGDGVDIPRQMPLLAVHSRYSLDHVLGSVRSIRSEESDGGRNLVGRLHFAEGDDAAERAWNKVRQGHLTDVSIGYRVLESTELAKGQTATIGGREFKAKNRSMRIATKWRVHEASIVPIGADQKAKTRSVQPTEGAISMPPKLREYLESIGLRAEATDVEAWQFLAQANSEQRVAAGQILLGVEPRDGGQRNEESDDDPAADVREITNQAIANERNRVREIGELAGSDVSDDLRQRAINEGWDVPRASQEFLRHVRTQRNSQQTVETGGPAIHTVDSQPSQRSLAAGLLIAGGFDPTEQQQHSGRRALAQRFSEQDADAGHSCRDMSLYDICREAIFIDSGGRRRCRSMEEVLDELRFTPSGGTLSYVFGTNVYARLVDGFMQSPDTTMGWCDEEDVPNFLQQEDISMTASSRLERLGRGGEAKHASVSDTHETYQIARYAKQWVVDEQDIIDDRLGAIMRMPGEMGAAARRIRPDLVYAIINSNPNLVADSTAVFASGHSNLGTAVLGVTGMKTGITAMGKQTDSASTPLNIVPRYLLVPWDLKFTAEELLQSPSLLKLYADSSESWATVYNAVGQQGLVPIADDRLRTVTDPRTGSAQAGSSTAWYLTSGPNRGLRVAYRQGTSRQPQMSPVTIAGGVWGLGWKINMDIGAAFMDYRGWYKSSGTA